MPIPCLVPKCPYSALPRTSYCSDHTLHRAAWKRLSDMVLARDGYVCWMCGGRATTADHRIPRSQGGAIWDPENCAAACGPCNSGRRDGTL